MRYRVRILDSIEEHWTATGKKPIKPLPSKSIHKNIIGHYFLEMTGYNCLKPNRVLVDLKNIYNDHRRKAYVALGKFEKVIDLQEHIQRLFLITGEVYLTTEDQTLLPPMETICVIHPTDIIR